jgi:RNA polymerase sigma-70 factor (ECF subfamily)
MLEEAIAQYMDQLKPDYKQVLELRWIHRLSYRDMADAMHASEGVVRQKLFRAREAIKERLQSDWGIE